MFLSVCNSLGVAVEDPWFLILRRGLSTFPSSLLLSQAVLRKVCFFSGVGGHEFPCHSLYFRVRYLAPLIDEFEVHVF